MAQYDGAIRIVTKITTRDAEESLSSLEYTIKKSAKEIDKLRQKMDDLKGQKIPTQDYKKLQEELSQAEKDLSGLVAKQTEWENIGITSGGAWDSLSEEIEKASDNVDLIKEKMQSLVDSGKGFTLGEDTAEYASYARQIEYEEQAIIKAGEHYKKLGQVKESYKKLGDTAKNSLEKINKSTKKTGGLLGTLGSRFKSLALSLLIFNQISKAVRAMSNAIKEGFSNLYNDKGMTSFKNQVDTLKASLLTLKNAFAAAFRPLVELAIPYIQKAIEYLTAFIDKIGQFMAVIAGQKTYTKAIKQTTSAIKDQNKAQNRQLSSLDKLNNLNSDKASGADGGAGGGMFEEVPVDNKFIEMANKIKEILSQIFQPLKTAWENQGKFVMDSWKYALEEIWNLAKSVGRDFLTVWNQPETISMLESILIIVGDIGLVVGNLANKFREAWETNDIGLHILENIRDIFAIIIEHIKNAADFTVEWSEKLDFYPLLESVNVLLEALKPLTDNIGAGLEWFWNNVLLPIAGWVIEDTIPTFLNMISAGLELLNSVLEVFQPLGIWLWENFLQPLGERAGETIISAMEMIIDLLTKLSDWISEHSEALTKFVAIAGTIAGTILLIVNAGTILSGVITVLSGALAILASPITLIVAAIAALAAAFVYAYEQSEEFKNTIDGLGERFRAFFDSVAEGLSDTVGKFMEFWNGSVQPILDEWATKFDEVWQAHIQPALNKFAELLGKVADLLKVAWENVIKPFIDWIIENILPVLLPIFKGIGDAAISLFGTIGDVVGDIIDAFSGIIDFLIGVFTGDWERAWQGIVDTFKAIFNTVVDIVEGVINGAVDIINGLIGGINSITVNVGIPSIPDIPPVSIPRLATGTVVPPNREFMAVLGDNKREPEVVSPLSTIERAVENAMRRNNGMGGGEITIKIPVEIDGNVLFELIKKFDREQFNRTGNPSFQI